MEKFLSLTPDFTVSGKTWYLPRYSWEASLRSSKAGGNGVDNSICNNPFCS